jgi:single-stranded-DNA-specific exonuclease
MHQGCAPWLARLLSARGVSCAEEAKPALSGLLHYGALRHIDEVARRLGRAIESQERIVVVGDYDADGATATAVAVLGLRMLGARDVRFVVPDRVRHGYGLSPEVVRLAAEHRPQVLITVDNGIAAFSGVEHARALGIDVIVTDHHLAADRLPDTPWIINPNQPGCGFAGKSTAGVGVIFYVLLAVRARQMQAGGDRAPLESLLDLVALGTVADVVPLDANNRRLVAAGLQRIRAGRARPLISRLFEAAKREPTLATSSDLGFYIGPRLNAAGRLQDMALGIEGLLCEDPVRAQEIAQALDAINRERRAVQQQAQSEACALIEEEAFGERAGIVVYQADWHEGVVGLVASQIKERYWRPTIVLCDAGDGSAKGSGRSIPGLHLRDALVDIDRLHPGLMTRFGGHAMAAGLTLPKAHVPLFQDAFESLCQQRLDARHLHRVVLLDEPPPPSQWTLATSQILRSYPWGQHFDEPTFGSALPIVRQEVIKDAHLRIEVDAEGRRIKGICFGRTDPIPDGALCAWKLDAQRYQERDYVSIRVESVYE